MSALIHRTGLEARTPHGGTRLDRFVSSRGIRPGSYPLAAVSSAQVMSSVRHDVRPLLPARSLRLSSDPLRHHAPGPAEGRVEYAVMITKVLGALV